MLRIGATKVKSCWKKYGTLGLIRKVASRVCLSLFSYHPHNFYGISCLALTQLQSCCSVAIREGGLEDIGLMLEMLKNGDESVVREKLKNYLDSGGEMFLAFSECKLVHVAWLFCNPKISEGHFFVTIKNDEAYIGRCDTHPEFRGKNIYPVILQHLISRASRRNKKRCFVATIPTNLASIRGIEKAGFSFVGKMRMFKLFGKFFNNQWVSSDTVKPE
jgi:GNAT superfamily N-acetyltransferase